MQLLMCCVCVLVVVGQQSTHMSARKKPAKQARTPPASGPERVTKPVDLETFLTLRDLLLCSPNSKEKARATIKLNPECCLDEDTTELTRLLGAFDFSIYACDC